MTQNPLIDEFLNYLKFERHVSPHTAKCYAADLAQFCGFLGGGRGGVKPAEGSGLYQTTPSATRGEGGTAPAEAAVMIETDVQAKLRTIERKRLRDDFSVVETNAQNTQKRLLENARRLAAAKAYQRGLAYLETGEVELAAETFSAILVLFNDTVWQPKCRKRLEAIEMGIYEIPEEDMMKSAKPQETPEGDPD